MEDGRTVGSDVDKSTYLCRNCWFNSGVWRTADRERNLSMGNLLEYREELGVWNLGFVPNISRQVRGHKGHSLEEGDGLLFAECSMYPE